MEYPPINETTRLGRRRPRRHAGHSHRVHHGPRSACAVLLISTILVMLTSQASCFLPPTTPFVQKLQRYRATRVDIKTSANVNTTDTWSRRSNSESRFGVRRRVREVLEKAKNRTGLDNYSSGAEVVAEAASIGSFLDEANLVFSDTARWSLPESKTNGNNAPSYGPSNNTSADDLVLESFLADDPEESQRDRSSLDVDGLLVGAEKSVNPLPFKLPVLSDEQKELLAAGERIQEQSKMGREGSGYVVLDVKAPPYVVWELLLDFEAYPDYIGTVRSMKLYTNTHLASSYYAEKPVLPGTGRETRHYGNASISRALFVLSKFMLNIAAVHKYQPHPAGHYMVFTLDPASKNRVMQDAKGIWYTQSNPDGLGEDVTRVWLLCEVNIAKVLPSFIVSYAAKRAMPRATTWLKPEVEKKKKELLEP